MHIHHYDPATGAYLGPTPADLDPLETEAAGEERYLIPAHATDQAPPDVPAGRVARWTGTAWEVVEDLRGARYWLPGDDWTHEGREMADFGPLPDGASPTRPEMPEEMRLAQAAEAVRSERDSRLRDCDYLMMPDYPIEEEQRAAWAAYRQALRDLPQAEGFPWGGPGDLDAPWPVEPP